MLAAEASMHTLASAFTCQLATIRVTTTAGTAFVDLTARLERIVADARIRTGLLNIRTTHTTTGVVVNEDEPLLRQDFEACLERLVPRAVQYAHDDLARRRDVPGDEPRNGHAHCRALLLPGCAGLTIADGRLALGRWQRVFLVELDGPREREVSVVVLGEPAP
jgi:secondary thiamine-phosphate synthase enzyme